MSFFDKNSTAFLRNSERKTRKQQYFGPSLRSTSPTTKSPFEKLAVRDGGAQPKPHRAAAPSLADQVGARLCAIVAALLTFHLPISSLNFGDRGGDLISWTNYFPTIDSFD
ncbi:hypothetical protein GWI33_010886 [Rhynchophorus ferrugineus]|uniref:Uncharacterized protein n=1 Tax=Rhynchophorus ferrugineus TaxID=354439 RepID=A0A834IAI9_RHYFE|nr:hypothetical protein GWI33_010886 [Rhynchophorus ferrugineus]